MKYEVLAETSFVNTYLFRGSQNAYPFAGCITGTPTVNRTTLTECEVSAGGVWSLAVQRNVPNQFYQLRIWYEDPISITLVENVRSAAMLKAVNDVAYFRYNVPAGAASTVATISNQLYFVLDNVVGGIVEISVYNNSLANRLCSPARTCSSIEGYVFLVFLFFRFFPSLTPLDVTLNSIIAKFNKVFTSLLLKLSMFTVLTSLFLSPLLDS